MTPTTISFAYAPPPAGLVPAKRLAALGGLRSGERFVFHESLVIGRFRGEGPPPPGTLWIADPTVSARHCVITQDPQGRCFVRDVSRNGTRVDHHRVVPGAEVPFRVGQVLTVGASQRFRLEEVGAEEPKKPRRDDSRGTLLAPTQGLLTVLVGDLRDYTGLVRHAPSPLLQRSVIALFRELEACVARLDGTVKEYTGDALLAFWEDARPDGCAVRACRAALALDEEARRLATDPSLWLVPDHPARMDWALATGEVALESLGGAHPVGLSAVGEAVVMAYRLEKVAGDGTGSIVACPRTRALAQEAFRFKDLGRRPLAGFEAPQSVFALEGPR